MLRTAEWIPTTAARVLLGIFFCISGATKLLIPARFTLMERTLAQSHIPFTHANAFFVSLIEFVCGTGLESSQAAETAPTFRQSRPIAPSVP